MRGRVDTVYTFWVRANPQLTQYEVVQLHNELLRWGARLIPTGFAEGDLAYKSRVRPSTFLHKKVADGSISEWGYLSTSQLRKPNRKPTRKPTTKAKPQAFAELKRRFGKDITPGGKS